MPAIYTVKPTVSVIIPCYNSEGTVGCTLASLKNQSHGEWEAIVVDDGSTDSSEDVIKRHVDGDSRFEVISQVNSGLPSARNAGLAHSRGEYVCFLDADDVIFSAMLKEMVRALRHDSSIGAVHCGWVYSNTELEDLSWRTSAHCAEGRLFRQLAHHNLFPCHGVLVRREILDEVGHFDCSLRHCHDWDLWLRVARLGATFHRIDKTLVIYRMLAGSLSRKGDTFFEAGKEVIRRGHLADSRVRGAMPEFFAGCQCNRENDSVFKWLLHCVGLSIAKGDCADACALLEKNLVYADADLNPGHMHIMRTALWLGSATPKGSWDLLWGRVGHSLIKFLIRQESRLRVPGFAVESMLEILGWESNLEQLRAVELMGALKRKAVRRVFRS